MLRARIAGSRKESSSTGRGRASPPRAWDWWQPLLLPPSSLLHERKPPFKVHVLTKTRTLKFTPRFKVRVLRKSKTCTYLEPTSNRHAFLDCHSGRVGPVMPLPLSIHGSILNPLLFQQFSLRSSRSSDLLAKVSLRILRIFTKLFL